MDKLSRRTRRSRADQKRSFYGAVLGYAFLAEMAKPSKKFFDSVTFAAKVRDALVQHRVSEKKMIEEAWLVFLDAVDTGVSFDAVHLAVKPLITLSPLSKSGLPVDTPENFTKKAMVFLDTESSGVRVVASEQLVTLAQE